MLQAVATLSAAPLPSAGFEQLGAQALEVLLPVLGKEPHEQTHSRGLDALAQLVKRMRTVPEAVVTLSRTAAKDSNAPAEVRLSRLHVAAAAFRGDRLSQALPLLPELEQLLEQAPSQKTSWVGQAQVAVAARIVLGLAHIDNNLQSRLLSGGCGFWTKMETAGVFNDRFYSQADAASAAEFVDLATSVMVLLTQHKPDTAAATISGWADGVVALLLHSNWRLRKSINQQLRSFLHGAAPVIVNVLIQVVWG